MAWQCEIVWIAPKVISSAFDVPPMPLISQELSCIQLSQITTLGTQDPAKQAASKRIQLNPEIIVLSMIQMRLRDTKVAEQYWQADLLFRIISESKQNTTELE